MNHPKLIERSTVAHKIRDPNLGGCKWTILNAARVLWKIVPPLRLPTQSESHNATAERLPHRVRLLRRPTPTHALAEPTSLPGAPPPRRPSRSAVASPVPRSATTTTDCAKNRFFVYVALFVSVIQRNNNYTWMPPLHAVVPLPTTPWTVSLSLVNAFVFLVFFRP